MSPQSMSHQLDMTLDDTKKLMQAYFDRYPKTKQQIDECVAYAKRTGEILTVFGDRLRCDKSRASTQGFNYRLQNGASVAMQAGFFNMTYACRQLGFDIHPKSVIHDSNQNLLWIVDLFYINYAYFHFFRQYERDYIGVDFKYDLELMRNYRDHTVFSFDYENSIMTLDGPEDDIEYYVKHLQTKWKLEMINESDSREKPSEDLYLDFSKDYNARSHQYCMHPDIKRNCDMVYGRKYKVYHDWENDEMIKKIDSLPLDMTNVTDRFVGVS